MTAYVDYKYYTNEFKGTDIPESSFEKKALEASRKVNYHTFGRITTADNKVKNTTCFIAELLYNQEQLKLQVNENKILSSETVGPHTKNYVNNISSIQSQIKSDSELDKSIYKICLECLIDTGLMYRGF